MKPVTLPAALALAAAMLALSAPAALAAPENWPQFRGADASGVVADCAVPDKWSDTENVAWKTDIPGRGWSSPVVWGNRIFLTSVVSAGETEDPKKGLYFGGERAEPSDAAHQWKVFCLDLESGVLLWERQVHEGVPAWPIHIKNSYASETPVTDGERLYVLFGNLGLWCLDLEGNALWKHDIPPRKMRLGWGTASSPVLHGDAVYYVNDNDEESYLAALDKNTGAERWRTARSDEKSNWSTPFVWVNGMRTELVTPGSRLVRSYDLDGKLLWSFKGMSSITIATPFTHEGLLFISSGYVGDRIRPLFAVRPGAAGDITLEKGQTANEFIAWSNEKGAPYNPTTLALDGRLYVLYDSGMLSCFDAKTGAPFYEREKLPQGRAFTASPWACGGKIFCLNEDGVTFVVKAGEQFELLHTNTLAGDDMGMATPAIVGDRMLLRTAPRIYCIR